MEDKQTVDTEPEAPEQCAAERAYEHALDRFVQATERSLRLEGIQQGVLAEFQDEGLWREQEAAWRVADEMRAELIATAPDSPTPWWPGGWTWTSETWRFGISGQPGQVTGTDVWRTEAEAHAGKPRRFTPEGQVTWTPTCRGQFRVEPLDRAFWLRQDGTGPDNPTTRT